MYFNVIKFYHFQIYGYTFIPYDLCEIFKVILKETIRTSTRSSTMKLVNDLSDLMVTRALRHMIYGSSTVH